MSTMEAQTVRRGRRWFRISLKSFLMLVLVCALLLAWRIDRGRLSEQLELATVRIEVFRDRKAFQRRLADLRVVNFDDVDASKAKYVTFAHDRYAAKGVLIRGQGGQYAGFGAWPDFTPTSPPNSYAPGPIAKPSAGPNAGGNKTDVTFVAGDKTGLVSGFGITFIDADYSSIGPSSLKVFGWDGRQIADVGEIRGASGAAVFVGVIAVNESGRPAPAISRIQIINGSGWVEISAGEGVTLDDLMFTSPVAVTMQRR